MEKILNVDQAINLSNKITSQGKTIVIAGGCFDILHIGHIQFLREAKKAGDVLIILLESDENIKKAKGDNRPINSQNDRATILANLEIVDYIIPLPAFNNDSEYDKLIILLKPAIIATTKGDPGIYHKKRQANLTGAKVIEVVEPVVNKSTTNLVNILKEI